jgi:predicted Zn-dependent protease
VARYGGVWRDAAATRRVNLIGRILGQYATRPDLDWRFGLLNSDAINAFSAPGGRVFITRGLYQILPKDDELAGVLAHEIIHIDQRHAVNSIAHNEMLSGFSGLLADNSGSFGQFVQVVDAVADEILVTGYDPDTEFDADAGGHDLADTTGFAPGGARGTGTDHDRQQPATGSADHPSADSGAPAVPAGGSAALIGKLPRSTNLKGP